jgi:transketolase
MLDLAKALIPTRKAVGTRLKEYGAANPDFAVFEADIGTSTSSMMFGESYPDRYFDMGIAELGMVSAAAGMAACGRTTLAFSYSIFLSTRALEAIRTSICYPNLDVKFMGSHGGLSAAIDGVTHQATEDIANISTLPNMKLAVPCDTNSAKKIFDISMTTPGPFYMRLLRDPYYELYTEADEFHLGGSHVVREGSDITIGSYGDTLFQAIEAADKLADQGISAEVIDFYSIKPFDQGALEKSVAKTGKILIAENHQKRNGFGYEVANHLMTEGIFVAFDHIGIEDTFAESGKYADIIGKYNLDSAAIERKAAALVKKEK